MTTQQTQDMEQTIIYGASDDLLEISGKFSEELYPPHAGDEPFFVAVSDGTLLQGDYDGEWKFRVKKKGSCYKEIIQSVGDDGVHEGYEKYTSYSDLVIFEGDITFVLVGGNNLAIF